MPRISAVTSRSGFSNKLRVNARRTYGFHYRESLVAMLFPC